MAFPISIRHPSLIPDQTHPWVALIKVEGQYIFRPVPFESAGIQPHNSSAPRTTRFRPTRNMMKCSRRAGVNDSYPFCITWFDLGVELFNIVFLMAAALLGCINFGGRYTNLLLRRWTYLTPLRAIPFIQSLSKWISSLPFGSRNFILIGSARCPISVANDDRKIHGSRGPGEYVSSS